MLRHVTVTSFDNTNFDATNTPFSNFYCESMRVLTKWVIWLYINIVKLIFHNVKIETMKTVEKTVDVLEAFLKHEGEMGITELAKVSGLNISTAYRIASVLVRRGYLSQRRKRGEYFIGPKFLEFSNVIRRRRKIENVAFPFLDKLNKLTNESVNLAILDRSEAVCIEQIESSQDLRIMTKIGARFPLYCTGVGKAFLAYMGEKEIERYARSKGLPYRTENTITELSRLKEELATIRQEGIAIDNEELELGVKCIGAPIFDSNGNVVATFNVSGPSVRLNSRRIEEIKSLIKHCSSEISRALEYVEMKSPDRQTSPQA